jgi:hypothetical protein
MKRFICGFLTAILVNIAVVAVSAQSLVYIPARWAQISDKGVNIIYQYRTNLWHRDDTVMVFRYLYGDFYIVNLDKVEVVKGEVTFWITKF